MLDPNLGIVNALGATSLAGGRPIPFLSQRSADISVLGVTFKFPVALRP